MKNKLDITPYGLPECTLFSILALQLSVFTAQQLLLGQYKNDPM